MTDLIGWLSLGAFALGFVLLYRFITNPRTPIDRLLASGTSTWWRPVDADHPAFDCSPAWSPDGTQLSFVTDRDGDREVYIMDADGSSPTNVTNHPRRTSRRPG